MFGRVYKPDVRDWRFQVPSLAKQTSTRKSRMWADDRWSGDQGVQPHCVGYAWAHWLANEGTVQFLQPAGIYTLAQRLDQWDGEDYEGTSVRAGAKVLKLLGFVSQYRWARTLDQIIYALLELGPVVVGSNWYESMMETNDDGALWLSGREPIGGHAYLINGVDTKRKRFRLKNSWGDLWGLEGRAYMFFEDLERLLHEDGEACLATEVKGGRAP